MPTEDRPDGLYIREVPPGEDRAVPGLVRVLTLVVAPGEDVAVEGEGAFQDWELIAVYERCRDRLYTYTQEDE